MSRQVVFLVGDHFGGFAENSHVMTLGEFRRLKSLGDASLTPFRVVVGQGLRHDEASALGREAGASAVEVDPVADLAPLPLTHKSHPRNVLITAPVRVGRLTYAMDFVVDDAEDRLGDHVTGQHIGGMLLIEAARQATIAAAELEFLAGRPEPFGFVWNGLRVNFTRFAFPLPTSLRVTLREELPPGKSQPSYAGVVEFLQAGQPVCESEMTFGLLPKRVLGGLELKAARRAVESARALCEAEAAPAPLSSAAGQ